MQSNWPYPIGTPGEKWGANDVVLWRSKQQKQRSFKRLWLSDEGVVKQVGTAEAFSYDGSEPLQRYDGTHPKVMQARIQAQNWQFQTDPTQARWPLKDRISRWIEQLTGWRPGEYRNYEL